MKRCIFSNMPQIPTDLKENVWILMIGFAFSALVADIFIPVTSPDFYTGSTEKMGMVLFSGIIGAVIVYFAFKKRPEA
jgi:hypothetical protein